LAARVDGLVGGFVLLAFVQLDHFGFDTERHCEFEQAIVAQKNKRQGRNKVGATYLSLLGFLGGGASNRQGCAARLVLSNAAVLAQT
jgi:hypothetical protein